MLERVTLGNPGHGKSPGSQRGMIRNWRAASPEGREEVQFHGKEQNEHEA